MNLSAMVGALPAIVPGGVSPGDASAATGLDARTCSRILRGLEEGGIGSRAGGMYHFEPSDRLSAALALVERGAPVDDVAVHLDWRSFEGLAARILESRGFATERNVILKRPRMEIDVIGSNLGVSVLVDCKHWRRYSASSLRRAVWRQVARAARWAEANECPVAVPAVVTLYRDGADMVDGVPVVPITGFSSFVDEIHGNLGGIRTIQTGSR